VVPTRCASGAICHCSPTACSLAS